MPQRLVNLVARQRDWSQRTFGDGRRTKGLSAHIRKELAEIADDPTSLEEWVDIILLGLDGAWRCGNHAPDVVARALIDKQHVNIYERTWHAPLSEDEPAEHDRDVCNMTEVRKVCEKQMRVYEPGLE